MRNVAIVINKSWNIYNFRLELLKFLKNEGYNIFCIAPKDEYSDLFSTFGYKYCELKMNNKGSNPLEDIKLTYDLYNIFKKNKIDLVLLYTIKPNIYGNIAARIAKIHTISTITGLGTVFLNDNLSSKVAKFLYKNSLKYSSKVLFQNNDDAEIFISRSILSKDKVGIVPGSGIDLNKYTSSKDFLVEDSMSFLFVARLVKDKGIIEYLEAAKILKQKYKDKISFNILGDYYKDNPTALTKEELEIWVKKGVVNYLGYSDDVKSVMDVHDCVVLPSYREGLSRVLLEAACLEKPIVTTNVPGCKDIVQDSLNGFLCEVKDVDSLILTLEKMYLLDTEEKKLMGKRSRQIIKQNFSLEIVLKSYIDIINSLLREEGR